MNYDSQIIEKCQQFMKALDDFARKTMGDDYEKYDSFYISLSDGRTFHYELNNLFYGGKSIVYYSNYSKLKQRDYENFAYRPNNNNEVELYVKTADNLDGEPLVDISQLINEAKLEDLSDFEKEYLMNFVSNLLNQTASMTMEDKTYSYDNIKNDIKMKLWQETMDTELSNNSFGILQSVLAAVNWWAEKISGAHMGGDLGSDFGDPETYAFATSIFEKEFSETTVSNEQLEIFKQTLAKSIMEEMKEIGIKKYHIIVDVDYNPCSMLEEAMRAANISTDKAPLKTTMFIDPIHVDVNGKTIFDGLGLEKKSQTRD